MRTVPIINIGNSQIVCIPIDMGYQGVDELEITREGDVITLRPARPSWRSLSDLPKADADFIVDRPAVIGKQNRSEPLKKLLGSVVEYVDPFKPAD